MIFYLDGNPLVSGNQLQIIAFVVQRFGPDDPVSHLLVQRSYMQFEIVRIVE
jgi:hypothetical protein